MKKILNEIIDYLSKVLTAEKIQEDTQLIEENMLDSLGIVSLLTFIETTFGIDLADDDFDINNFSSPLKIAELIHEHSVEMEK
ncbi:D-alanine--poly(phosphoribitol) ligase subunit 2 [Clostridium saccharoperbutylacetonicum]|jgi:D-alanine--poly(phosphoribitol) ligase subunit 2|uniref:Phosphopantetheine attachment site n=1 Tax=Clostridium saccharoperbutylacetonicum N1-4(HMT) TaxID=931276 RepID=M1LMU0_9CLOT|nr:MULTISPECIES: phosphopantetheine-binding protein [Clostridium]AGF54120.1 phosphopantetheine attachment site [Clostridium saccharoperbutylacetonicum N1-4(HMT)]NRT59366.1 D-alanine--poly(phosphoribitol) ligase subunit 2 [Clostridium saccharoperbutylacetonicum]NSB28557.1 D-alanine--poly(phosphoribitol) ligase subunit 2 [Clostridium saccharoperbutylacetonicum]NSB42048.1 D-alanine--poly(phosphoribitol) ligase subunit 2 [Clostridium saccharoperbutylacetonicum]